MDGVVNGFYKMKIEGCDLEEGEWAYASRDFIRVDEACVFDEDEEGSINEEEEPVEEEENGADEFSFIPFNWDGRHRNSEQWSQYTYDAVQEFGQDLLASDPDDIDLFCPNYNNLNREGKSMFWIQLIASMTEFESGFRPETSFTESFRDSQGDLIVSRGLLQISIESARGYDCDLRNAQDLHDAQRNLECGIRIMNRWVMRDGRIAGNINGWKGGARYWSVLRKRSGSQIHDNIVRRTVASEVCK